MRLVGNEVGALHLVDGLNLGESCQVFVIKDLIIHFSLGKRNGQERSKKIRGTKEKRAETKTGYRRTKLLQFPFKNEILGLNGRVVELSISTVLEAIHLTG
jgi:hypothetical protein